VRRSSHSRGSSPPILGIPEGHGLSWAQATPAPLDLACVHGDAVGGDDVAQVDEIKGFEMYT
jgi:hypothetical protein